MRYILDHKGQLRLAPSSNKIIKTCVTQTTNVVGLRIRNKKCN